MKSLLFQKSLLNTSKKLCTQETQNTLHSTLRFPNSTVFLSQHQQRNFSKNSLESYDDDKKSSSSPSSVDSFFSKVSKSAIFREREPSNVSCKPDTSAKTMPRNFDSASFLPGSQSSSEVNKKDTDDVYQPPPYTPPATTSSNLPALPSPVRKMVKKMVQVFKMRKYEPPYFIEMKNFQTVLIKHYIPRVVMLAPRNRRRDVKSQFNMLFLIFSMLFLGCFYITSDNYNDVAALIQENYENNSVNLLETYDTFLKLQSTILQRDFGKFTITLSSIFQQPLSIITSQFIHYDWGHFMGNMAALYIFGPKIYAGLGPINFFALFAAGNILYTILHQTFTIAQNHVLPRPTLYETCYRRAFKEHYPEIITKYQAFTLREMYNEHVENGLPTPPRYVLYKLDKICKMFEDLENDQHTHLANEHDSDSYYNYFTTYFGNNSSKSSSKSSSESRNRHNHESASPLHHTGMNDTTTSSPPSLLSRKPMNMIKLSKAIALLDDVKSEYHDIIQDISHWSNRETLTDTEKLALQYITLPVNDITKQNKSWEPRDHILPPSRIQLSQIEREVDYDTRLKYSQNESYGPSGGLMAIIAMYCTMYPLDRLKLGLKKKIFVSIPFVALAYIIYDVSGIMRNNNRDKMWNIQSDVKSHRKEDYWFNNSPHCSHLGGLFLGYLITKKIWNSKAFQHRHFYTYGTEFDPLPFKTWYHRKNFQPIQYTKTINVTKK